MTVNNRLEQLKKQRATLDARIQAAEARSRNDERKKDTRRKILVGAYYLEQAESNNQWAELQQAMNSYLTRDNDRKLFNLPLRKNTGKEKETETTTA